MALRSSVPLSTEILPIFRSRSPYGSRFSFPLPIIRIYKGGQDGRLSHPRDWACSPAFLSDSVKFLAYRSMIFGGCCISGRRNSRNVSLLWWRSQGHVWSHSGASLMTSLSNLEEVPVRQCLPCSHHQTLQILPAATGMSAMTTVGTRVAKNEFGSLSYNTGERQLPELSKGEQRHCCHTNDNKRSLVQQERVAH